MKQKFTILFDLDGTLVDTAPDLMHAHNHVMKQFGYPTKSTEEIRNLVGQGAGAMLGRSIWGQAKKEFSKVEDEKIKKEMINDFIDFYGKNIVNESTLIKGVKDFLIWSKENNISISELTSKVTESFSKDCHYLNCEEPTHQPKATENIDLMIEMISELIKKEFAYENNKHVYFEVKKFKDYGQLSNKKLDE